ALLLFLRRCCLAFGDVDEVLLDHAGVLGRQLVVEGLADQLALARWQVQERAVAFQAVRFRLGVVQLAIGHALTGAFGLVLFLALAFALAFFGLALAFLGLSLAFALAFLRLALTLTLTILRLPLAVFGLALLSLSVGLLLLTLLALLLRLLLGGG